MISGIVYFASCSTRFAAPVNPVSETLNSAGSAAEEALFAVTRSVVPLLRASVAMVGKAIGTMQPVNFIQTIGSL